MFRCARFRVQNVVFAVFRDKAERDDFTDVYINIRSCQIRG